MQERHELFYHFTISICNKEIRLTFFFDLEYQDGELFLVRKIVETWGKIWTNYIVNTCSPKLLYHL